jgi:Asp-tRNA(Asn)/Glu-tRNA(Gln) amidotransferase A subunit family amidase
VSSRELVTHVLDRIDELNPRVNAVVARDDEAALAAAEVADRARRDGDATPLLGLPVTIKDSIEVAGLPSTSGSFAREGFVPERDATVVARLRDAGAIVVAKTNVPEYTWSYETENVLHGRTVHPLDLERTCGGSSGGEAALLGVGASIAGVGTDGGGSIRVPSHYCGTAGLRPTAGLVPETGVWPSTRDTGMLDMNAVGPMARTVEDLELLLPVLAGADGVDPFVHDAALAAPPESLRVGFYGEGAVEAAAACFEHAEAVKPPDVSEATELFFALMAADGGEQARRDLAPAGGRHVPQLAELLENLRPLACDATAFFALVRRMFAFRARVRAFVAGFDVVIAPVTTGPAPPHGCVPGTETPLDSYDAFNDTHTYSVAGLPVAVVRAGTERGLPIGVQIVANPFHDRVAVAAAAAVERA